MSAHWPLLDNWSPQQREAMHHDIFVAHHRLAELDLFSDEGLVRILAAHPAADLGINTMGDDPERRSDWREGAAGSNSPEELLECVKQGKIWLNLRRVMDHHPEYRDVVDRLYDELERTCGGEAMFNRSANLLISSPTAMVYYHLDCPANMLWHIRGTKRVWAYPLESGIVSDETIEGVLCGEKPEELDFRAEYDQLAQVFDVEPGDMITWPQHTPHRVVNTSGINVSLSTEHMTRRAVRKNNVYLANRHFRQLLGGGFRSTQTRGVRPALKEFALRVARRLPLVAPPEPRGYQYNETFVVDRSAPNCVRLLDGDAHEPRATILPFAGAPLDAQSPVNAV